MDTSLVSVVVPVYNSELYIKQCIDSIICQSYRNLEIIVVDDGSTDSSLLILQDLMGSDTRIKIIEQKNQGVSKSRANGMRKAQGEYLVFVDSDDWLDTDVIEKAVKICQENDADVVLWPYRREHRDASIPNCVFNDKIRLWEESTISQLYRRIVVPIGEELKVPYKVDSISPVWGKLYKRELVKNIDFVDLNLIGTSEDTLFNIYAFSKFKRAVYFAGSFYHYRKYNSSSITYKYNMNLTSKWNALYELIYIHLREKKVSKDFLVALNNRICLGIIGLGINITEDSKLTYIDKRRELKRILNLETYKLSLSYFDISYLPVVWRVLFLLLKYKFVDLALCFFYMLNLIRKTR